MLARLAKLDVLVLDDFLIAPLKDTERRDLLEVLEDRYGTLVDGRDLAGADQKLARDAGRPYHRRRYLRPLGPQRPRRRHLEGPRAVEKKGFQIESSSNPPREGLTGVSFRSRTQRARRFAPTAPRSPGTSARITPERAPGSSGIRRQYARPWQQIDARADTPGESTPAWGRPTTCRPRLDGHWLEGNST